MPGRLFDTAMDKAGSGLVTAFVKGDVAAVKAGIAPGRLLIHEPQDGWGRLCAFLGVPVPDAPYPSRNSAEGFRQTMAEKTGVQI